MGLTKEQWIDAIEDIQDKVFSGVYPTAYATGIPAEGKLPEMLFAEMEHCIGFNTNDASDMACATEKIIDWMLAEHRGD